MSTKIQWTEETWNPTTGCAKVSAGCKNCYAEKMHNRLRAMGQKKYQHPFNEVRCHPNALNLPARRKKPCMIFVNSMSDLFHPDVGENFIMVTFQVMLDNPQHTYQLLTKRPERIAQWIKRNAFDMMLSNLWLGTSVENQQTADERIPYLLDTPAAVRWLSIEPMLGTIDIPELAALQWVVVGAESGANRRPCEIDWVRSIVRQCKTANVPVFVKQLHDDRGRVVTDIDRFPADLQVREYPEVL